MCVFRLHWESFLAQFSALKLPLNATVEMGGVNQVTHRVQSLVCRDVTLFSFFFRDHPYITSARFWTFSDPPNPPNRDTLNFGLVESLDLLLLSPQWHLMAISAH